MTGKILLVQVDHVAGDMMGFAINRLIELGAKNVQLLQAITKKNRPSYVLLIDLPADKLNPVSSFLASELGVWGYHIMDTKHIHFDISFSEKTLLLKGAQKHEKLLFKVKHISNQDELISKTIEHDFLILLNKLIREQGYFISINALRSTIEAILWSKEGESDVIELELDALAPKSCKKQK